MLSSRYEVEYAVSSHDPEMRYMSYDTTIAEALLVARRLHETESPTGRGVFVNLWRMARQETDALALTRAVTAAASTPVHRSDGPPIGGSALIVGGEQWGEIVDGPVGPGPWKAARWRRALTGQFAAAVERGELWTEDGTHMVGRVPVATMREVCNVGPQHRRIRGSLGVFDGHHGWSEHHQFPAIWSHKESTHQSMLSSPNAHLIPKPDKEYAPIWAQSGTLQITPDVQIRFTKNNLVANNNPRTWCASLAHLECTRDDPLIKSRREIALALWCNSSLGMLLHANHSSRTQRGRGIGNKAMLESLTTLDVRKLETWQLEEAQVIWRDFTNRKFQSFHSCAVDPARLELDERVVRDLLNLGDDAVAAVANLRTLLASEPSIHGSKNPKLAS